jgi:hypothetical protein
MNEDRRKFKRRYLMYYSRVFDRQTGSLLGHVVDITPEGIMLISEKPLEVNRQYKLRMELPDEITNRPKLDFDAHSVWNSKDVNPDFYDTGFRLLNVPQEDVAIIERMITDYGLRE